VCVRARTRVELEERKKEVSDAGDLKMNFWWRV